MLGCTLVVLVFFVFNLIGIVNPIERQIETMLFNQLDRTVSDIRHDTDDLAAWGISLSDQLSDTVADILQERRLSFDDLRNNPDLLNEIQQEAYNQIYTHMQLTTSSGAFYFLDTTVNDALPETYYNGLYLKYANLYAENTIHNKPCVFRGNSGVAAGTVSTCTAHGSLKAWQVPFRRRKRCSVRRCRAQRAAIC